MGFLAPAFAAVGAIFGTGIGAAIGQLAVGIGLNFVVGKLFGRQAKNQEPRTGGVEFDREYGENVPRRVACGLVALAGHDCYVNTYGEANKYLQQVFALSDYPCDGLSRIWAGGKLLTLTTSDNKNYSVATGDYAGRMSFRFFDGTQEAADSALISNSNPTGRWTEDHIGDGICYIVVNLTYDQEKLNQFPDFLFEIRGARLYDPRKDSTVGGSGTHRWGDYSTYEFSKNPIIMDYNYRRGFSWNGDLFCGMGMPAGDLPVERFAEAANICDEGMEYGIRYECSILLDATAQHGDNIDQLMTSCGGIVVDGIDGSWPIVGTEQPIVETFTDADLILAEPVRFQAKRSMADLVNMVSGTYPEPDNLWSPTGYDIQTNDTYVAIDRRTRDISIDFPMVSNKGQANQLASIYFKENRFEKTADIVLRPRFQTLKAGDWVYWDSADAVRKGTYIVQSRTIMPATSDGPRNVALSLQEREGSIYDTVEISEPLIPIPNSEPVFLNELQDFAVIAALGIGAENRVYSGFRLSWAAISDPTITGIDFQWWVTHDEDDNRFARSVGTDVTTVFVQEGIVSLTDYSFRYKLRSNSRATSWSTPIEITSKDGGANDITVGLANINRDAKDVLKNLRRDIDGLRLIIEGIATDLPLIGAIGESNRRLLSADLGSANASVVQVQEAFVNFEAAFARQLDAVVASMGDVLAEGLLSMVARTDGDVLSQIEIAARARRGEPAALAALILRVINDDDVLKSQLILNANQLIFTDDSGEETHQPFVIEDGVLKGNIGHFGTIFTGMIGGPDSKLQIDVTNGTFVVRT